MKLPRNLYGRKFANQLIAKWNYIEVHQTGSHILLRTELPSRQTLSVPEHKPLRTGTLSALLKLVAHHKGIQVEQLLLSVV